VKIPRFGSSFPTSIPRRELQWAHADGLAARPPKIPESPVEALSPSAGIRRRSVEALGRRLGYDEPHARHAARQAVQLFDATRRLHELGARDRELLDFAALLHEVGRSVGKSKHHKHSYYLIRNGGLDRFASEEIQMIAAIARFHRGSPPKPSHEEIVDLPTAARRAAIQLAAILRVAESLDGNHVELVLRRGKLVRIYVDARKSDAVLAISRASKETELWERVFDVRLEFRLRRRTRHATSCP
jgi:exopolyphosphatase / guanosine-5'-triphosphate,3'-diphosphate pyrophosphatase